MQLPRRAAADRGRMAARRRGRPARAGRAARLELDGERALGRADAVRDPQGRLRLAGGRLGLDVDGGPQDAALLAQAAAARRAGWRGRRGSASGWRSTCREPDAADAARRNQRRRGGDALRGPLAAMFLGDFGADVIKIEHPTTRRSRARPRAEQGRDRALVQGARPQQAARHARPLQARRAPTSSCGWRSARTSWSRTSGPGRWSAGASAGTSSPPSTPGSCWRASPASARPARTPGAPASARSPRR